MTETSPLTTKALARLKALAQGNNINPEKIELVSGVEEIYVLKAQIKLEPRIDITIKKSIGRPKSKNHKLLTSFDALNQEIQKEKEKLQDTTTWVDLALKDLKETQGHGWGHQGATIFWDQKTTLLMAHENCPTCRGSGQSPCPACQGIGTIHCTYCDGRKQELCSLCHGHGRDPINPENPCPQCHGTNYHPCRFCNSTGRLLCERCGGKANIPCADCQGTGFHAQEAQLKKCATLSFTLGTTIDIPSGLLRLIQRIGEDNLSHHATITIDPPDPNLNEDPTLIHLTARIPYAELRMHFNGKGRIISVFGKNARLAGVPTFLDDALKNSRATLTKAAKGKEQIEKALTTQIIQNALFLVLQGKTHVNELRRLYPAGLSSVAAKEIMDNMALAIRTQTRKTRLILGIILTILTTLIFSIFFFTPFLSTIVQGWNPLLIKTLLVALPFIAVAKCWGLMLLASRIVLKRRFKKAKIGPAQPVGKVGYITFASIAIIYIIILFIVGILP